MIWQRCLWVCGTSPIKGYKVRHHLLSGPLQLKFTHLCKMSSNTHMKMVIDTDAGCDDAHAMMMVLARPAVEVLGITTVGGNCTVDLVCKNALRVLRTCSRLDIPVYRGSQFSVLGKSPEVSQYHCADGFGDVPEFQPEADKNPPDTSLVQSEHAVQALLRLSQWHRGSLTLVALGPLTNIALAQRLDPEFGSRLRNCYIMGGNTEGQGNITTSAEFNFHHDPEAAQIVLNELKCPITQIGWEVTLRNQISWDVFDDICAAKTQQAKLLRSIHQHAETFCRGRGWGFIPCDQSAMAVALDESVATEYHDEYATVELDGKYTRGQMVIDFVKVLKKKKNCKMVTKLDAEKLKDMMKHAVAKQS